MTVKETERWRIWLNSSGPVTFENVIYDSDKWLKLPRHIRNEVLTIIYGPNTWRYSF